MVYPAARLIAGGWVTVDGGGGFPQSNIHSRESLALPGMTDHMIPDQEAISPFRGRHKMAAG
jgi:hypothetical protein